MLYSNRMIFDQGLHVLPPEKSCEIPFFVKDENPDGMQYKLRLRGDVDVQQNWMWEGGYPYLYRDIDDSLCDTVREHSQFSLHFGLEQHRGISYPKRAYCKLDCPPRLSPQFPVPGGGLGAWDFSVWVKGKDLKPLEGGAVGVRFEIWNKQEGMRPQDINRPPEKVVTLPFDFGTYEFRTYKARLDITEETAVILITFYGENSLGDLWLEDPRLEREGQQILPQFTLSNPHHEYLNWMGENLSRKEWTSMGVKVNGFQLPDNELFQRCYRGNENEIAVPPGLVKAGENVLTLTNKNKGFAPLPFRLMQCELLSGALAPFTVICWPRTPAANGSFPILLHVPKAGTEIQITAGGPVSLPGVYQAEKAGLQVLKGTVGTGGKTEVTLVSGGCAERLTMERTVEKAWDNVLTGTSDAVYIPQDDRGLMQEFLCWYLNGGLGNFITFRPVYRWTGARSLAPETWKELREILTELEQYYCHLIDGRELPGLNANPTKALLDSPYFVGNQGHERDGALYYWRQRPADGSNLLFSEVFRRNLQHPDFTYTMPIHYTNHGNFLYYDPIAPQNMEEAAMQVVNRAKGDLAGIKRHTGPSVLFRYFFMAGLPVGGAELMYGPQEIIISAMRGASLAYHREETAAHLAVQWSSTPHDTPERFARYRLALYTCYLQGVNHINTEEGLYRMEEMFSVFDRFSNACKGHFQVQQEFAEFVRTHSRRGTMQNRVAFVHGRYDGWVCFTRPNVWGHYGDDWKFGYAEESWDLLKLFYPESKLQALYVHPCPKEPQGFFSSTPLGNGDILPVEAEPALMDKYPLMAFMGYNAATAEQVEKLLGYVNRGGTVLLTRAHFNTSLERADINASVIRYPETPALQTLLGFDPAEREPGGGLVVNRLGKGCVYLVDTQEYPAHPAVKELYSQTLVQLTREVNQREAERGFVETEETVQFGVFDHEDMRTIYLVNTNWWALDAGPAAATLVYGEKRLPLQIPFGTICTLTLKGGNAAFTADNTTEVLDITETGVRLQGGGEVSLLVLEGDAWKTAAITLDGTGKIE